MSMNTHRLVAMLSLPITEGEALSSRETGSLSLQDDMMHRPGFSVSIGCFACELQLEEALARPVCEGEPVGYYTDGSPIPRGLN